MPEVTAAEWDRFLSAFPSAHLLQTASWGELKSSFGWQVARVIAPVTSGPSNAVQTLSCGAQILFRKLPLGFSIAYIPKGPVGDRWESLLPEIDALCRRQRAVFLKIEPDQMEGGSKPVDPPAGFIRGLQSIQPPRTLVVDLGKDEADILDRMKQKTRYNVRLALKKGVIVRQFGDVDLFCRLMRMTGQRDRFGVHSQDYYQRVYDLFSPREECVMLLAEYEGEPLAALMVFARGQRAWYFYGASADTQRERMPTYILQWEAMRWARQRGCLEYDLWGVPDADEKTLESNFALRTDGLWGVYRFKRGFGGELRRAAGPWDRVYAPMIYRLYSTVVPKLGDQG